MSDRTDVFINTVDSTGLNNKSGLAVLRKAN